MFAFLSILRKRTHSWQCYYFVQHFVHWAERRVVEIKPVDIIPIDLNIVGMSTTNENSWM